jgi:hypothetical protein
MRMLVEEISRFLQRNATKYEGETVNRPQIEVK